MVLDLGFKGSRFGVWGSRKVTRGCVFEGQGLGFEGYEKADLRWCLGVGFMVEGSAMKAQALGFGVEVSGRCPWRRRLRVSWFGFLVSGFRFQVWGFTFRSSACELRLKVRGVNFCGGSGV
jgi:hypothetical protein